MPIDLTEYWYAWCDETDCEWKNDDGLSYEEADRLMDAHIEEKH